MKLKFLLLNLTILGLSICVKAQEQAQQKGRYKATKTTQKIEEIIPLQKLMQVEATTNSPNKKFFGGVQDIIAIRQQSRKSIKSWYNSSLDTINFPINHNSIAKLDKLRIQEEAESEKLYFNQIEVLYAKNKLNDLRIFPAFTGYMSMLYNNSDSTLQFFQNTSLNFGDDNASFRNEIVSGYLWIFKTTLSTVLAKDKKLEITADEIKGLNTNQLDSLVQVTNAKNLTNSTLIKVISGGGEANISMRAPLFNLFGNRKGMFKIKSDLSYRISADLPVAGTSVDGKDVNFFNVLSMESKLIIPVVSFDVEKKEGFESFAIFGKYDINSIGGSSVFYKTLGIPKERFWYAEFSGGLIYKNFLIFYTNQKFNKSALGALNRGRFGVALTKQF